MERLTIANLVRALAVGVLVVYLIVAVRLISDDNVGVAAEVLVIYVPVIVLLLGLAAFLDARSSTD